MQVKRATFSVIQAREINLAWNSMRELDYRVVNAVDARSELDLRVGAVFTRFQTLLLRNRFKELEQGGVLSYGSCQFPTLGFIVDAYNASRQFVPEPFWFIRMVIAKDGLEAKFTWSKGHLFDQHLTLVLYEMCLDDPFAIITKVDAHPKSKWAPLPLTTVELQKLGSRSLKIPSDRIMQIAESLYNQGFISYPRTETDVFDDKFALHPLIQNQVQDTRWGAYAQRLLDGAFRRPRKGKNNDQAHPPIHPVKAAPGLDGDDKRVYDLVVRRFLACCSDAARGHETVVTAKVGSEIFTAKGLQILERNYLDVYPFEHWNDQTIPVFQLGERYQPSVLEMQSGQTTAPSLLTEADLITLMDKSGIGTDATIHEHIKKVQDRHYANKEGQYFYPSTLGMALISSYDDMNIEFSLSKPHMRSQMEIEMRRICEGHKTKESVVDLVVRMYQHAYKTVSSSGDILVDTCAKFFGHAPDGTERIARDMGTPAGKCIECGHVLYLKSTKEGKRLVGCSGYPDCKRSKWLPEIVQRVSVSDVACTNCAVGERRALKLDFTFRRQDVPHTIPTSYRTCIWCDQELLAVFDTERRSRPPLATTAPSVSTNNSSLTRVVEPMPAHTPICTCGQPCLQLTVRKEGPNNGRPFFCCNKPTADASRCNMFQWADVPASAPAALQPTRTVQAPSSTGSGPACRCGNPSILRTVRKAGPTEGRTFFVCAKNMSDTTRCDMFQWEDEPTNTQNRMDTFRQMNAAPEATNKPKCDCQLYASQKSVSKEGPNKGKAFYSCPKVAARCNFFQWVDEEGDAENRAPRYQQTSGPATRARGSTRGRARGTTSRGRGTRGRGRGKSSQIFPSLD